MKRSLLISLGCLFLIIFLNDYAICTTRTALVIGNSDYKSSPLKNPENDAKDMAKTLRGLGFEVVERTNADKREMVAAMDEFYQHLKRSEVGLFYYAGHGMQISGSNYLIPVNANISTESDVEFEAVDAGRLLGKMKSAGNSLNIIILDACRDNPFKRSFRSSEKGLARMDAPRGSLLAYATAPGQVAVDGEGRNGLYTKHLLAQMTIPGMTVEKVLKQTRINVVRETRGKQTPWESTSLMGDFYFADSSGTQKDEPAAESSKTSLTVTSNISGASVYLDDRHMGNTSIQNKTVSSGTHKVKVTKDGYEPYETSVNILSGRHVTLDVYLEKVAPVTGTLYVNTQPADAVIRVLNIRPKYARGMSLSPGEYHVEISKSGYETKKEWILVSAAEDRYVTMVLESAEAVQISRDLSPELEPARKAFSSPSSSTKIKYSNSLNMEFVYIEPGTFMMGSPATEKDRGRSEIQQRVALAQGYYLQTTEVTQGQWKEIIGGNPSVFNDCGDDCPVENVSWEDVQIFINKINSKEETNKYRLPTEAEWEYACRAGSVTAYCSGDNENDLDRYAWYSSNSGDRFLWYYLKSGCKTHPVAQKQTNAWGLYDMHGNVQEWCADRFGYSYPSGYKINPEDPPTDFSRGLRGGGYGNTAMECRSAYDHWAYQYSRVSGAGFRLARNP